MQGGIWVEDRDIVNLFWQRDETTVSMNHQDLRIYCTDDGRATWREIGNPYDIHISVLTGAGFASDRVGFISYRYYEDVGPDIW